MGSNCAIPSKAPTVAANSSPLIQQLPFQQAIELQAPQIPAQKSQRDDLKGLSRTSIVMRPEP